MVRPLLLLTLVLALAGCAAPGPFEPPVARPSAAAGPVPAYHVVRAGETLFRIAARYGRSVADLARWNGLGDGSMIRVGQRIRLHPPDGGPPSSGGAGSPPAALPAEPAPPWQWPVPGPVVAAFGQSRTTASGIQFGGALGAPVHAAADGVVVYSGRGLAGYGALVIIKHNESWLTAYGHNQALLVGEGERIRRGQEIARMGEGPGRRPLLHFEIRRNGEPVDPVAWLPPR